MSVTTNNSRDVRDAQPRAESGFAPRNEAGAEDASKVVPPPQVLYRICRPGWAVIVEKTPNAQGTRFVCPFCPVSHRVSGPVRGFEECAARNG